MVTVFLYVRGRGCFRHVLYLDGLVRNGHSEHIVTGLFIIGVTAVLGLRDFLVIFKANPKARTAIASSLCLTATINGKKGNKKGNLVEEINQDGGCSVEGKISDTRK